MIQMRRRSDSLIKWMLSTTALYSQLPQHQAGTSLRNTWNQCGTEASQHSEMVKGSRLATMSPSFSELEGSKSQIWKLEAGLFKKRFSPRGFSSSPTFRSITDALKRSGQRKSLWKPRDCRKVSKHAQQNIDGQRTGHTMLPWKISSNQNGSSATER